LEVLDLADRAGPDRQRVGEGAAEDLLDLVAGPALRPAEAAGGAVVRLTRPRVAVDDGDEVGTRLLAGPHLLDRGGPTGAGRVVEGLDRLPPVGQDLAARLPHRAGDRLVLVSRAPVDLVLDRGEDVEPQAVPPPEVADGVGPGGHRLRFRRFQQLASYAAELVR